MSKKKSFLVRSEVLGLLANTLLQFIAFLKTTLNFEQKEKNESHSLSISEIIDSERRGYLNT